MVISATVFSGSVTNVGTIGPGGISVIGSTVLSGGIVDFGGTISGGITIDNHSKIVASPFAINVRDTAVVVAKTSTFGGVISNAGIISAVNTGIAVGSVAAFGNASAASGIRNAGLISPFNGLSIFKVSTFSGGISNSGTISGAEKGITVAGVTNFSGGISNGGRIAASTGILFADFPFSGSGSVAISKFSGGIRNGGTIAAEDTGIIVAAFAQGRTIQIQ
jgi:hypothetical protein